MEELLQMTEEGKKQKHKEEISACSPFHPNAQARRKT